MRYLKITGPDVNNGPGCRITLWIPGCGHKCKGCHNEWTHMYNQGSDFTEGTYRELIDKLSKPYIAGLTISGGDPLYQSNNVLADLYEWITRIRTDLPDKTIWLYTGFKFEDLQGIQMEIVQKCDVVVDGPYIEELRDTTLEFRGSSNQRIIHIGKNNYKDIGNSKYIISNQNNKNSMIKRVFKGIINGKEFNDVASYNEEMTRLMNNGCKNIQASSSTNIMDVCDRCGEYPCNCEPTEDPVIMLPGFEIEDSHYLDRLVTDNTNENYKTYDLVEKDLIEKRPKIFDKIENMDLSGLESYMTEVDKAVHILHGDKVSSDKALDNVNNEIKNLEKKKMILEASLGFINLYDNFYQDVLKTIYNRADKLDNNLNTETCRNDKTKISDLLKVLGII